MWSIKGGLNQYVLSNCDMICSLYVEPLSHASCYLLCFIVFQHAFSFIVLMHFNSFLYSSAFQSEIYPALGLMHFNSFLCSPALQSKIHPSLWKAIEVCVRSGIPPYQSYLSRDIYNKYQCQFTVHGRKFQENMQSTKLSKEETITGCSSMLLLSEDDGPTMGGNG